MSNKNKVINGTYGKLWINGVEVAELSKFSSKVTKKYEERHPCGQLGTERTLISWDGEGSYTVKKVYSSAKKSLVAIQKTGKDVDMQITGKLADKNSAGQEGIVYPNCITESLNLMDFESGKVVEDSVSFKFNPDNVYYTDSI